MLLNLRLLRVQLQQVDLILVLKDWTANFLVPRCLVETQTEFIDFLILHLNHLQLLLLLFIFNFLQFILEEERLTLHALLYLLCLNLIDDFVAEVRQLLRCRRLVLLCLQLLVILLLDNLLEN